MKTNAPVAQDTVTADVARQRRQQLHVVLSEITSTDPAKLVAELIVNEAHPYFFDHPLDHVPGPLMIEGILQLAELATQGVSLAEDTELFVSQLKVRFHKFCEKQLPVSLSADYDEVSKKLTGEVLQGGLKAASFTIVCSPAKRTWVSYLERERQEPGDPGLVHKHRSENVLVNSVRDGEGVFICRLLPPPPGHLLGDGGSHFYSPLYLLDGTRQAITFAVDSRIKSPDGVHYNLIAVQVAMTTPAQRHLAVELVTSNQMWDIIDDIGLATLSSTILIDGRDVGKCTLKVQVVDSETYKGQRGFK